jgi:hypothetical protein
MSIPIIGAGEPSDRAYIPLATRIGNTIPNERRMERNKQSLMAALNILTKAHPKIKLRSLTATYNCLGMVFASRRTCIDTSYLHKIITEDGYRQLSGPHETELGDVVIYRDEPDYNVTHVAIIIDKMVGVATGSNIIKVISQWGADGEYVHLVEDVPFLLGKPIEYWTDRRLIT